VERSIAAAALAGLSCLAFAVTPASAASPAVHVGDAVAHVEGSSVTLANATIARRWTIDSARHVSTVSLRDVRRRTELSAARSPDFSLALSGVPTSSLSGWALRDVRAGLAPRDPARPDAGRAVEVVFRYDALVAGSGLELVRTVMLHPGAPAMAVSSSLVNHTPAVARIGKYSLDELTSPRHVAPEVDAYNGGSDWRDDFRHVSHPAGQFDSEGEVARFDDGHAAGWYFVSERRGGAMHRVGRESSGRTFAEVDSARDVFDFGPLQSDPPGYNRLENPVYPVPVRERTLLPGATLRLGRAYLGVYSGGRQGAATAFAAFFATQVMPHFDRSVALNSFHPWNHGAGMSDRNLRGQVEKARGLGVESFMLDDQWQGGPGGESGDWYFDQARFPYEDDAGPQPEWVEYLHSKKMKLGLWMSPLEFHPSSRTYAAHRDWACAPTGDASAQVPDDAGLGAWDVTNPGFRAHLTGVIDRLVREQGVTEFKFDFMVWLDCPPHDYLDYEDSFVSLVRSFQARHPRVTFEIDETNDQRSWAFESAALGPSWFDNGHLHGSTFAAKQLHDIWSAAPWLPPSSIGSGLFDGTLSATYHARYLVPMALLGHVTFWTDLRKIPKSEARETAWWIRWYKRHRATLAGAVAESTTADPIDGRSWAAFEPWRAGKGYLFAFRQSGGPAVRSLAVRGVSPRTTYVVRDVRSGRAVARASGRSLAAGLRLRIATPFSARVLSIEPARRRASRHTSGR
jgi:hypothetical protein